MHISYANHLPLVSPATKLKPTDLSHEDSVPDLSICSTGSRILVLGGGITHLDGQTPEVTVCLVRWTLTTAPSSLTPLLSLSPLSFSSLPPSHTFKHTHKHTHHRPSVRAVAAPSVGAFSSWIHQWAVDRCCFKSFISICDHYVSHPT